jgi:hypothetical protein
VNSGPARLHFRRSSCAQALAWACFWLLRAAMRQNEADIRVTRDLIRAGQLLKIDVLDHVVIGRQKHCSLREFGHFL